MVVALVVMAYQRHPTRFSCASRSICIKALRCWPSRVHARARPSLTNAASMLAPSSV